MLYNKNLNCGATASSEPHRNVFADLHKKKKAVFTCENCFFLTQKRYASGLLIDRSGSSSDFCLCTYIVTIMTYIFFDS
jgi:hypothetical protein